MNQLLKPQMEIYSETGVVCRIEEFLGDGGQGEVYKGAIAENSVAVKWYFPAQATDAQRTALTYLVQRGSPNHKFLWPISIMSSPDIRGFGYVMPLRDCRYKSIVDLMKQRVEPSFWTLATAGFELADSFFQLHSKGLCYRDISFGNVFFDPQTGEVLICDNDNVTINGQNICGVLGTPRFMAPEVVRGEIRPCTQTDLYSLSVLLFYLLMVHHPLEGKQESSIKCFDQPAMNKLYGTNPIFVFDPQNDSNRPVPGYHDNALAGLGSNFAHSH
jgi:serine/threonine protein kinase